MRVVGRCPQVGPRVSRGHILAFAIAGALILTECSPLVLLRVAFVVPFMISYDAVPPSSEKDGEEGGGARGGCQAEEGGGNQGQGAQQEGSCSDRTEEGYREEGQADCQGAQESEGHQVSCAPMRGGSSCAPLQRGECRAAPMHLFCVAVLPLLAVRRGLRWHPLSDPVGSSGCSLPGCWGQRGVGVVFFSCGCVDAMRVVRPRVCVCVHVCVFECMLRVLLPWCAGRLSGVCFCACALGVGGGSLLPRAGKWWSPVVSVLAGGGRSPVMYFHGVVPGLPALYTGGCRLCLHLTPQDRRPFVALLTCVRIIDEYDKERDIRAQ